MSHPCGKTTASGQPCKNTVAAHATACAAGHAVTSGPIDLMAALKASVQKATAAKHAAAADPMAVPPATPEPVTPEAATPEAALAEARRTALGAGYQALNPTRFLRGLTPWQAATTLQDAAADTHAFADRIADLRPNGTTTDDLDPIDVPEDLNGPALIKAAQAHLDDAMAPLRSTQALADLNDTDRDDTLATAQRHAITAAAMLDKAAAEHTANTAPNAIPTSPRGSRKAAHISIRQCLDATGDGPLGPQRARTLAETLRVTSKHLTNLRAALGVKQPLTGPKPATDHLGPDGLTDAATTHLTAARDLLAGTSGLTEAEKAHRATTAHANVRTATHYLKALMTPTDKQS